MVRILFLVLWTFCLGTHFAGAIEIYVDGHKFDSFHAYQESRKPLLSKSAAVDADLNKISDLTAHKLYVLGIEAGVTRALESFSQAWGARALQMPRRIYSGQLQEAIQQAVTKSMGTKLLLSQPGKVRIMAMTPHTAKQ